jgi:hypothetical protein
VISFLDFCFNSVVQKFASFGRPVPTASTIQIAMGTKRKRGDALPQDGTSDASPAISTVTYKSGKEIRDALQTGTKLGELSDLDIRKSLD